MTTDDASILGGSVQRDIESHIVHACSIDYEEYLKYKDDPRKNPLTQTLFEKNFKYIIKIIDTYEEDNWVAYQVLGYLILRTGSKLSKSIKKKILFRTDFKKEDNFWLEEFIELRKFYLNDLRNSISNHENGKCTYLPELVEFENADFSKICVGIDQLNNCIKNKTTESISYIELAYCNLTEIPKELYNFKSLKTLSLRYNSLKVIPEEITQLTELKELYLDGNDLENLPRSLIDLKQLNILAIGNNNFKQLPSVLKEIPSLKRIYAWPNPL